MYKFREKYNEALNENKKYVILFFPGKLKASTLTNYKYWFTVTLNLNMYARKEELQTIVGFIKGVKLAL